MTVRQEVRAILKEIAETEKACGGRTCTGCKWNRRIRKVLKRLPKELR